MAKQTVNLGTAPSGAGGDTFRSSASKFQANDNELYAALGGASGTLPVALPIANGGTGGTTVVAARTALGLGSAAIASVTLNNQDTTSGSVLKVGDGGLLSPIPSWTGGDLNGTQFHINASWFTAGAPANGWANGIFQTFKGNSTRFAQLGFNDTGSAFVRSGLNIANGATWQTIRTTGKVMGWGGANDGVEGKFIFNVDALAIGSGDSVGYYPFIFRTTPYTDPLTGTVFPVSAYMKSAMFDYQSVKTSHIEDLAVKTAKIDALAVTTAKIDNLAVTEGKIANLAVDTLKIKDNAVTVPVSAFAEAATTVGTDYITIQTLAVPSDMGHTILTFGAVFSFTSYTSQQRLLCRVLKNGNVVFEDLEVHFVDYDSVGVTSDNSGQHQHSVSVTVNGSANDAGNHSHSFNGSTGNSSAGSVANSFHSHNYNGSTNSGGSHGHNLSLNANASMGLDGIHSHNITIRGSARSAGTLNISRHDSTGIAGTFQLQLKSGSGGNVSVSQRYIHAMTMRK